MSLDSLKNDIRTGIDSLDHGHRRLVGVMETICDNFERAEAARTASDWFDELYTEVSAHFALKEAHMGKKGNSSFEAHKADHERLLEQIRSKMESYELGKCAGCGVSLRNCLEAWYAEHAREMDMGLCNLTN